MPSNGAQVGEKRNLSPCPSANLRTTTSRGLAGAATLYIWTTWVISIIFGDVVPSFPLKSRRQTVATTKKARKSTAKKAAKRPAARKAAKRPAAKKTARRPAAKKAAKRPAAKKAAKRPAAKKAAKRAGAKKVARRPAKKAAKK
jgi:hypothetical protein